MKSYKKEREKIYLNIFLLDFPLPHDSVMIIGIYDFLGKIDLLRRLLLSHLHVLYIFDIILVTSFSCPEKGQVTTNKKNGRYEKIDANGGSEIRMSEA